MAHKKKHTHPVPPGNQPQAGPAGGAEVSQASEKEGGAPFQEQDPKRRLGDFTTAGEHSFQQPGGKNDANR